MEASFPLHPILMKERPPPLLYFTHASGNTVSSEDTGCCSNDTLTMGGVSLHLREWSYQLPAMTQQYHDPALLRVRMYLVESSKQDSASSTVARSVTPTSGRYLRA